MKSLKRNVIISLMILSSITSIAYNHYDKRNERKKLAIEILSTNIHDFQKYLNGIDFNKPVTLYHLNTGDIVIQYQVPGAPQGNFYGFINSKPDELGISAVGFDFDQNKIVKKEARMYEVVRNIDALSSYAAPVKDDWSTREIETQTKGTALQLFSDCKVCFKLLDN